MGLINKSYLVTLNQRVQGSNPCAPTNRFDDLCAMAYANCVASFQQVARDSS